MADNVTLNAGTGGDVIAADDVGGAKYQRVKLSLGADGTVGDAAVGAGTEAGVLRVTLATDSTGVLSVDDNGSSISIDDGGNTITVDGTVTANATLAAETTKVIGTVNLAASQTLATVTTVAAVTAISNALPAGNNNIGDVDVASVIPGTTATSLGKAEDAAHTSADVGVMALAVRRDADTSLVDTTGDYAPLQVNAAGSLKVAIISGAGTGGTSMADGATFTRDSTSLNPVGAMVETAAPTLVNGDIAALSQTTAGALRVSIAGGGIAGIVDDAAFTPATSEVLPIGFTFDDSSPDSVNEGDIGAGRMSANRNQYVTIRDAAGNERGLNIDSSGNLGIAANSAVNVAQINGVAATMGNGASGTGVQRVTIADNSTGVLATVSTVTTVGTVTNITNQGHLADDATFTPGTTRVMMAGFEADETAVDSVDEGDGGAARMSLDRKIYTIAHQETGSIYQNGTARAPAFGVISAASSGNNTLLASLGGSLKCRVTSLYLIASGTVSIRFESGADGTALSGVMPLTTQVGLVLPHNPNGWFETAAATLLNLELSGAVGVYGGFSYIPVT